MTLDLTHTSVVAVVCGNAIVGRALELLLRSTHFSVRLLVAPSLGKPESLDGVQLLLLAPGLDLKRREALLELIDNRPPWAARIPILELVDSARAAQEEMEEMEDGHFVSWPCRAEDLKQKIKVMLLAGSEESHEDNQGLQTPKKKGRCPMIEVSVEVSNNGRGGASFGLSVRAESIGRAVSIADSLYPGWQTRVVFPIEPETFFVEDHTAMAGPVELEMPESVAG